MRSEVGKLVMAHSRASGKALLSQLPKSEVDTFLANCDLPPVMPNTITEPQELEHELDLVRSRGYAVDMEEDQIGGACIAAPIFDHKGKAIAAVSISISIPRLRPSEIPSFGAKVMGTARAISQDVGYVPQDSAKTAHLALLLGEPDLVPDEEVAHAHRQYVERYGQDPSKSRRGSDPSIGHR